MTGLELLDRGAIAVSVDDSGAVAKRAHVRDVRDLGEAARQVLQQVGNGASLGLAIAAVSESAASAAVVSALRKRSPESLHERTFPSGTAAAVAEAWIGAATGRGNVVFLGVGDHVTAGILRDAMPVGGAARRGPAIGWLALNPVEREDYRKIGCLEAEVAAPGIVRRLIWRIKAGDYSAIQDVVGAELSAVTIDHVLDAARQGDGVSISVLRDTAKYMGMAAANLVAIVDPEIIVLGGIMASAADLLLEPVRAEIGRRLPPATVQTLTIVGAQLGVEGPAIGAARLASAPLQ